MNTQHRRILDLLAGWGMFADEAKESESDEIHELYQQVGSMNTFSQSDFNNTLKQIEILLFFGTLK